MSNFQREERYVVIKLKKLNAQQLTYIPKLHDDFVGAMVESVVVESDWPEYNFVWLMLEHRMAGYPVPDFNAVKCAADVANAKRDAHNSEVAYRAAIGKQDELRAEVERLRALLAAPVVESQEPVYQTRWYRLGEWDEWKTVSHEQYQLSEGRLFERRIVNTSPPAPVAVDERAEFDAWTVSKGRVVGYSGWRDDFAIWQGRACLDKVKELN